jgi:uncharacterized protein YfiM (DUF2279 family)
MRYLFLFCCCCWVGHAAAQSTQPRFWSFEHADSLHRPRAWAATGTLATAYTGSMIGLWHLWYADYPIGQFRQFDDSREWLQMDKLGHLYAAYQESRIVYGTARWAGVSNRRAAWAGFAGGQLFQLSFEVFDGFSEQWGFSWSDVAANSLGAGLHFGQQLAWQEQRITLKASSWPQRHSTTPIAPWRGSGPDVTLDERARELYGTGPVSLFLKNYNAQTVWVSVNPRAFMGERSSWWPRWLNVAGGYGADNMFGGFGNEWQADKDCTGPDCATYRADPTLYPRTRQYYLSLDVDLTRIRVRNRALRFVLHTLNVFKIPSPTLEWRQHRGLIFHPVYF